MASKVIEKEAYNGKFNLRHDPNAKGSQPRYVVMVEGEKTKPKGVTTIMGQTLAKDLMSWAVDCCVQYLRDKLPVVTEDDLKEGALEHTRRRDSGASSGTEAHALVEQYLKGEKVTEGGTVEANNAFQAFLGWFQAVEPEVINVEEVIYSDEYKYCGTYDCMLRVDGKVYLCDLKTTNASRKAPNGVYAENFIQLGAYALAHEEQRQYEEANGGTELVKIEGLMVISAKKDGKLDIATNSDLGLTVDDCSKMFKYVVNLYQFLTYATKQLGGR